MSTVEFAGVVQMVETKASSEKRIWADIIHQVSGRLLPCLIIVPLEMSINSVDLFVRYAYCTCISFHRCHQVTYTTYHPLCPTKYVSRGMREKVKVQVGKLTNKCQDLE
jgi:hypothetical protein